MKKSRILILMHPDLVPPDTVRGLNKKGRADFQTEWDVVSTLTKSGHEVIKLGVYDDLGVIRRAIEEHHPDVAFNLLEEFDGRIVFDMNVVSYLELLRLPYTGCNPRGLVLSRDKALSKKILHYHRIPVPDFAVFPIGRKIAKPKRLEYPLIVKSLIADASAGISQASVVDSDERLRERVVFIHRRLGTDAIAEQYVGGREIYCGVIGNERLRVLPAWEMVFKTLPSHNERIATARVKWNLDYQKKHGITTRAAKLPKEIDDRIVNLGKRVFRRLGLSGYARMDFRLDDAGRLYLIEANPNPQIARLEDFAQSAKAAGITYPKLLDRIVRLALRNAPTERD